ncbi:MAG TPA: hypothetical protein VEC36_02635, partial [Patescibacteria group bacterium]|nr:hypothetical protein [Patescibacteria group bacterium]
MYTPNGRAFATFGKDSSTLFDSSTEQLLGRFPSEAYVTFSPGGKYILLSDDIPSATKSTSQLWDLQSGRVVNTYQTPKRNGAYFIISPDSLYIAIATIQSLDVYRFNPITSVEAKSSQSFNLSATPNPAHDVSAITFTLLKESPVKLFAYDAAGRNVIDIFSGNAPSGENRVVWNLANVPQGTYV